MLKKPFSSEGRIRRLEYGITTIIYSILMVIIQVLVEINEGPIAWIGLAIIPLFWFYMAQGAKRCHDRGNSGWYQLIPFYGFWMLFGDSDPGVNYYGPNPKGNGNPDGVLSI